MIRIELNHELNEKKLKKAVVKTTADLSIDYVKTNASIVRMLLRLRMQPKRVCFTNQPGFIPALNPLSKRSAVMRARPFFYG